MPNCGIVWKFNTPVSPWMCGSRESLLKLPKKARKTGTNDKTYQCTLNSRPFFTLQQRSKQLSSINAKYFLIKKFDSHSEGIFDTSLHEYRVNGVRSGQLIIEISKKTI